MGFLYHDKKWEKSQGNLVGSHYLLQHQRLPFLFPIDDIFIMTHYETNVKGKSANLRVSLLAAGRRLCYNSSGSKKLLRQRKVDGK